MSLFSWLFSKPSAATADAAVTPAAAATPSDPLAELKQQRHDNRESLYEVVRSVMLRSEVLSSHYKFKVLSLDARGRQFLVMIDLLNDATLAPHRWSGIEQLMTMTALQHHDLEVKGLYWRLMMQPTPATSAAKSDVSVLASAAAPAMATAAAAAAIAEPIDGFEPIHQDEVMAFKKAIAEATPAAEAAPEVGRLVSSGPRKAPPAHGYEDTQLIGSEEGASPLSKTQYGGLD